MNYRLNSALLVSTSILDFARIVGSISERPRRDSFSHQFHCGTGLAWTESKDSHIANTATTQFKLQLSLLFEFLGLDKAAKITHNTSSKKWRPKLMTDIIFLDGGLGQEIHHRFSNPNAHPLWSLQVMYDKPELVTQVHYDFIKAGSKVLSLNNYTATPQRLQKYGNPEQFSNSHQLAASVLAEAIKQADINRSDIDIAGSLPPLVASYVASEALDFETSVEHYKALIAAQKPHIDLFLIETMSNISEAKAAITALTEFKEHALVGMTICDDFSNTLRSGEALELAVEEILATGASALMLNCSYPEAIDNALPILAASGVPFGAYANGFISVKALTPGTTVDNLTRRQDLSKKKYAEHVHKWLDLGATIIGGCCEIGPEYIRYLRDELDNNGHHLVSARQSGILTGTISS